MNTTENNKLIVQFMELEPIKVSADFYALQKNHVHITGKNPEIVISGFSEFAKYNTDFNWLMEVVDKILNTSLPLTMENIINQKRIEIFKNVSLFSSIDKIYIVCIEFIKWYNEQK